MTNLFSDSFEVAQFIEIGVIEIGASQHYRGHDEIVNRFQQQDYLADYD